MSKTLSFIVDHQDHQQWCWVAVSVSVSKFYDDVASPWTQCKLVDNQLPGNDCCINGGSEACNQPGFLDKGLQAVGHFNGLITGALNPLRVINEIDNNRPVCARIGFSVRGHFVGIRGYEKSAAADVQLVISDPTWGESTGPYDEFSMAYLGSGSWTDTYLTK